jgi:hypothetical protein
MNDKIHLLRSPNRNYLGHQDFPVGIKSIQLTIDTAQEEIVRSVVAGGKNEKKVVIRFIEKYDWLKPFICNITNRHLILNSLQKKNITYIQSLHDLTGVIITLVIGKDKGFMEYVGLDNENITQRSKEKTNLVKCLRIKDANIKLISELQQEQIAKLINEIQEKDNNFNIDIFYKFYNIKSIKDIHINHFNDMLDKLRQKLLSL